MSSHLIGTLLAILGVVCFSIRPVLVKLVYAHGVDPTTLLTLRLGLSLPIFVAIAAWFSWRRRAPRIAPRDWLWIIALGVLGNYLAGWLDMAGLQYVDAGLGRLILFLYPTLVVLLSAAVLGKRIGRREALALATSYAGLALVLLPSGQADGQDVLRGALLIFGGAACYAIYLVAGAQVVQRVGVMAFPANGNVVAFGVCLLHFLAVVGWEGLDRPLPVYGYATVIALVSTVLPVFVIAEALRRVGANQVALIGAVGPMTALMLGHVGLGETMSGLELLGAGLILGGVVFVTVKPEAPPPTR